MSALLAQIAAKPAVIGLSVTLAGLVGAGYFVMAGPNSVLDNLRGQLTELGSIPAVVEPVAIESIAVEPGLGEIKSDEQASTKRKGPAQYLEPKADVPEALAALPSFDIVRVAASGEAVITGFSAPDERIEVVSNGKIIAQAEVGSSGDWAIVLDAALPPGGHNLIVRAVQPDSGNIRQSIESITVAILENPKETPIVLLDKPDRPGELLQSPSFVYQDDPPMEFNVAASATDTPRSDKANEKPEELDVAINVPTNIRDDREAEIVIDSTAPTVLSGEGSLNGTASTRVEDEKTAPNSDAKTALEREIIASDDNSTSNQETASAQIKVDDRNEQAALATGEGQARVVDAGSVVSLVQETTKQGEAKPVTDPQDPALPVPAPQNPDHFVTIEAVEAETAGALYAAGASNPGTTIRVYFDGELIGETRAGDEGRWLLETDRKLSAGKYAVRVEQVVPQDGNVRARREVSFTRSEELVSLIPATNSAKTDRPDSDGTSQTASNAPQLPNAVIIRKGDNLWSISRRLYGSGTRYTTIYGANGNQIRNPSLIYPGQVFILPK